ncbi:substrate-binding domain-containing protein [Marivita cryptomonadis]|uniref:Substrate-binding domain-containing protein n=1 Tax=Marivita cryptomonadis TaxID=505252 RepID=A0A9Q2P727_9RHOB|nr:substrate-binding domain-containing protein [Marivita cryptomonadis]MBM2333028.1 substrate-binding domain-containing protein [Marivita cryptomonadis]MBM2342608.1 substrate-binding domain-containing protein [Marivita cryptomonadis]MBM2347276.1 substrate-binding domain-containing protein [Marivita cryptomonadis]MBM2351959.1 substrate-binding domain-containing protein [Marivita cryptomonadis]
MLNQHLTATTIALFIGGAVWAQDQSIIVQSTTSTANSGLYDHLLPIFQAETGIQVNVVAVGTGQAIKNAENCDGDVLLVHAKASEEKFVADGFGTKRTDLMYNDFVVVGPAADPAGVAGMNDVQGALAKIADGGALFASRGDDSGTHKKEMALWADSGVDPSAASGGWYRETGSGMGATLNAGIGMGAYVMTDRATWISFANKQDYQIAVQGDEDMFNQYGVIPVNPARCPSVNVDAAQTFADWLVSDEGQDAIAGYKVADQQLFFPNAPDS